MPQDRCTNLHNPRLLPASRSHALCHCVRSPAACAGGGGGQPGPVLCMRAPLNSRQHPLWDEPKKTVYPPLCEGLACPRDAI